METDHLLPLLELYTSEGCSSCPPADRWLSSLARAPIDAVPLAFHVDYWDDLGWKDRYASPAHTRRQQARVAEAGGRVVYTPQVMLGENVQVKWSDGPALARAATDAVLRPAGLQLELSAQRAARGLTVRLAGTRLPGEDWRVQFALYRDDVSSVVTAGENRELTLHHDRVATALHGPWPIGRRDPSHWFTRKPDAGGVLSTAAREAWPIGEGGAPQRLLSGAADASGVVAIFTLHGEPGTGWALDLPLDGCADEPDAAP